MIKKPCNRCGLIQLYDDIWGFAICHSDYAQMHGCPDKEMVMKNKPEWHYADIKLLEDDKI